MEKFVKSFGTQLIAIFALTVFCIDIIDTKFGYVFSLLLTIGFILYLIAIITLTCVKLIKNKFMVGIFIAAIVLFVLSIILSSAMSYFYSDLFLILGIILIEVYLICLIINNCFGERTAVGKIVLYSTIFIVLGFLTIYISAYNKEDNALFDALVTVFAAIIGGSVTLAGIAWTINQNKEDKKQEELQKAMPYFTFNILRNEPSNIDGNKICFPTPDELQANYKYEAYAEIENSRHSVVVLKRIHHDKKWYELDCNNLLIHSGKIILNFRFSDYDNIILEVEDTLHNLYYYSIKVVFASYIKGKYTIRRIDKLNNEEIEKFL